MTAVAPAARADAPLRFRVSGMDCADCALKQHNTTRVMPRDLADNSETTVPVAMRAARSDRRAAPAAGTAYAAAAASVSTTLGKGALARIMVPQFSRA